MIRRVSGLKCRNPGKILELRQLILASLFLQIVLLATGNRRKYISKKWLATIIWLAYLSADYVATLALGTLARSQGDSHNPRYGIMAFWAPFLLIHLGGPDTITAYALADNELWSRHLLQLIVQAGVAFYVLYKSWISTLLNYLSTAVFAAGLIKYGERTFVLFQASRDQYRDSMVSPPDPGPNYAKFMDEYISKEAEGYIVSIEKAVDTVSSSALISSDQNVNEVVPDARILQEAYYFFQTFKQLFADLILSFQDREISYSFFKEQSWNGAFGIIEVELGLMYDLFYTKAFLLYSPLGIFLRSLSLSSTLAVLVGFSVINKDLYPDTEVIITYILLYVAIFLEGYAFIILLTSDRTMIWLSADWAVPVLRDLKDPITSIVCKMGSLLRYLHIVPAKMKWSNEVGQYNVLSCCLEGKPKCKKINTYLRKNLEKYLFRTTVSISDGLKTLIFEELKCRVTSDHELHKKLGSYMGDKILLKEMNCFDKSDEVEFSQSLLLWHIATDLCYHSDGVYDEIDNRLKFKREMSRLLSDYMMYLLIMSPAMLPSGIGQIQFQDTCAEAVEFFETDQKLGKGDACQDLLKVDTRKSPSEVKGDRSKTLLFDACRLAKSLRSLEFGQRWEKIFQAWLDILTFAAAQCRWNDHAEKLGQGGELLTHVWLLMAHFGMTDHFQISQGYVRAKLQTR